MRKLFMTDLHGEYTGMIKLLNYVRFNPIEDQLVLGGDLIDRGKDSGNIVKEVKQLCEKYPKKVKAIIGNHEEMANWHINFRSSMWLKYGGLETIQSFNKVFLSEKEKEVHFNWLFQLPLYLEDDEYIYTHAGLYPYEALDKQNRKIIWMEEAEFYSFSKESLLKLTKGKPIIHGHTPCEYIFFDGIRMNCNLGSYSYSILKTKTLGLVDLTHQIYYIYHPNKKQINEKKILLI